MYAGRPRRQETALRGRAILKLNPILPFVIYSVTVLGWVVPHTTGSHPTDTFRRLNRPTVLWKTVRKMPGRWSEC
jgi:hypothetical protein